jgi:hypothetical protein
VSIRVGVTRHPQIDRNNGAQIKNELFTKTGGEIGVFVRAGGTCHPPFDLYMEEQENLRE